MFRSYAVDLNKINNLIDLESCDSIYKEATWKKNLKDKLIQIFKKDAEVINASEIQQLFFPETSCPVFLSHSGKDKDKVRQFAQWLKKHFEINSFIDSDLWGCIANLQSEIDNSCLSKNANGCFKYDERNKSTAHVHLMLCHALTQMIDEAECFIFLKSSNSISIKNSVEGTFSPWIFHELATVETIRENKSRDSIPDDISECDIKPLMENADCDKKVFYPISLKKSFALTSMDLENWSQSLNSGKIQNDFFSTSEQEYLKQAAQYCENVGNGSAAANEKWEKSLNWLYKNCNNKVFDYDKTSSIL